MKKKNVKNKKYEDYIGQIEAQRAEEEKAKKEKLKVINMNSFFVTEYGIDNEFLNFVGVAPLVITVVGLLFLPLVWYESSADIISLFSGNGIFLNIILAIATIFGTIVGESWIVQYFKEEVSPYFEKITFCASSTIKMFCFYMSLLGTALIAGLWYLIKSLVNWIFSLRWLQIKPAVIVIGTILLVVGAIGLLFYVNNLFLQNQLNKEVKK